MLTLGQQRLINGALLGVGASERTLRQGLGAVTPSPPSSTPLTASLRHKPRRAVGVHLTDGLAETGRAQRGRGGGAAVGGPRPAVPSVPSSQAGRKSQDRGRWGQQAAVTSGQGEPGKVPSPSSAGFDSHQHQPRLAPAVCRYFPESQ